MAIETNKQALARYMAAAIKKGAVKPSSSSSRAIDQEAANPKFGVRADCPDIRISSSLECGATFTSAKPAQIRATRLTALKILLQENNYDLSTLTYQTAHKFASAHFRGVAQPNEVDQLIHCLLAEDHTDLANEDEPNTLAPAAARR